MDLKPIKHLKIKKGMKISELVGEMKDMGFGAGKIARASEIMARMFNDSECKVFLGIAGAMVPSGLKDVIVDMLDDVDVFVTTGANLTHDLIEALGEKHYHGNDLANDKELHDKGIDRIYNVLMKKEAYKKLEDFFEKNFEELAKCKNIREFLWKLGEILSTSHHHKAPTTRPNKILTNSILQKCYEKKIPIFCPGIADSGIGLMMWGRIVKGGKSEVGVFDDLNEIIDFSWRAKKTGVIYLGGGVPKNFIQQSLQFSKGADLGVQITIDRPEPGGSSGAPLREGISWGKMKADADFVDVFCDATIALPLIYGAVKNAN